MKFVFLLSLIFTSLQNSMASECNSQYAQFVVEQGMMESAANDCGSDGIGLRLFGDAYSHFLSIAKDAQDECSGEPFSAKDWEYLTNSAYSIAGNCVAKANAPTYTCSDGQVNVRAYISGEVFETRHIEPHRMFSNSHKIEIDYKGETYVYDQYVVVSNDGAGQDVFQSFYQGGLSGFTENVNFYFEHEGWYLAGGFYIPLKYGPSISPYSWRFGSFYSFKKESMKCQEE